MRMSHNPPWLLAKSQLPKADTRDPRWRGPVGDGAKRPTILFSLDGTGMFMINESKNMKPEWNADDADLTD
jgi:hypothetical protein